MAIRDFKPPAEELHDYGMPVGNLNKKPEAGAQCPCQVFLEGPRNVRSYLRRPLGLQVTSGSKVLLHQGTWRPWGGPAVCMLRRQVSCSVWTSGTSGARARECSEPYLAEHPKP